MPLKPRGATPTIVIDWPLTMIGWFSTAGLPPSRVVQYAVAEHRYEMTADVAVVVVVEQPAERRLQAEHRKVRPGHEQALPLQRLTLVRKVRAEPDVRGDAGEDRLGPLEIAEHRIAEDLVAIARLAA